MAYKYRLETVLTVRKNKEEQVQYRLAHEISVFVNQRHLLAELLERRLDLIQTVEEKKKLEISGGIYTFYMESLQNIDRQIEFQKASIQGQKKIIDDVRVELAGKVQEKRIVEKMKEKDYRKYVQEIIRKEQNDHDEMAVLRHGRGLGK